MALKSELATPEKVLELFQTLPPSDQWRVVAVLNRYVTEMLPESATLDEAIDLYMADVCSLGRAAELAGVTRWVILDTLKQRGVSIPVYGAMTADEMDDLFKRLEQQGML